MGRPHGGAPRGPIAGGLHGGTAFRDGWTAWRRASRNPAAPRNAVSPWEAGAPRSAASRWEVAANPWLGAIAVLAYWKFESISLQQRVTQTIGSSAVSHSRSATKP